MRALDIAAAAPVTLAWGQALAVVGIITGTIVVIGIVIIVARAKADNAVVKSQQPFNCEKRLIGNGYPEP